MFVDNEAGAGAPLPDVVALEENRGFAGGANVGLAHAFADGAVTHALLMNDDIELAAGALAVLAGGLRRRRLRLARDRGARSGRVQRGPSRPSRVRAARARRPRLPDRRRPLPPAGGLGARRPSRRAAVPVLRGRRVVSAGARGGVRAPCRAACDGPARGRQLDRRRRRARPGPTTRRATACGCCSGSADAPPPGERLRTPRRARSGACASRSAAPSSRECATGPSGAWGGGPTHGEGRVRRGRVHAEPGRQRACRAGSARTRFRPSRRTSGSSRVGLGALRRARERAPEARGGPAGRGVVRRGPRPRCATCGSGRAALPDVPRAAAQTGAARGRDRPRSRRPARAGLVPGVEPHATAASSCRARSGSPIGSCACRTRPRATCPVCSASPSPGVRVVPNGIDDAVLGAGGAAPVDGPYILFVGTPEPRKNLARLVAAVMRLVDEGRPERLVLAGADGWGGVELPARARIVQLGRVDDSTLRDLYAHARCVAYPSLWEGFGLVAGEALATGCPVVCSDIPALREVAGTDAAYCDPTSVESIADALRTALDGERPAPRRALTWEAAAQVARRGVAGARPVSRRKLVLVDADTVGRARTGDEAYTINLLRELPVRGAGHHVRGKPPRPRRDARRRPAVGSQAGAPGRVSVPAHPVRASAPRPPRRRVAAAHAVLRRPAASAAVRRDGARPELHAAPRALHGCVIACCSADSCRAPCAVPDRVIAVSEFTRGDLLDRYGLDPERVVAIPNGVAARFHPDLKAAAEARASARPRASVRAVRRRAAAAQERAHARRGVRPAAASTPMSSS